jgi:quercetin dioxygenase-like cupin family protein
VTRRSQLRSAAAAPPRRVGALATKPKLPVIGHWHVGSFAVGLVLPILVLAAWLGTTTLFAEHSDESRSRYPIFQGNKTILGETISYPSGTPLIKAVELDSHPGEVFDWHIHKTPAFGYILEGEVTVDYGSRGIKVVRAGDAFLEALDWPHQASNRGATRARIFALYIGVEGTDSSTPVAGPK